MRSARTGRPHPNPIPRAPTEPRSWAGGVGRVLLAATLLAALAACATGEADDARRGQSRAATRGAELPAQQATRIASQYASPAVSPQPTAPAATGLEALALSLRVDSGGPDGEYDAVPADAGTVYAGAKLSHLRPGQQVRAVWRNADRVDIGASAVDITDPVPAWVALPLALNGSLPTGDYAVYVSVADGPDDDAPVFLNSLVFRVIGSGSAPVRASDRPAANPDRDDGEDDVEIVIEDIEEDGP